MGSIGTDRLRTVWSRFQGGFRSVPERSGLLEYAFLVERLPFTHLPKANRPEMTFSESCSREVRIRVPCFSVVYFSRGNGAPGLVSPYWIPIFSGPKRCSPFASRSFGQVNLTHSHRNLQVYFLGTKPDWRSKTQEVPTKTLSCWGKNNTPIET